MELITVQDGQEKLAVSFVEYANERLSALRSYPLTTMKHKICINDYLEHYPETTLEYEICVNDYLKHHPKTISRIYDCYADFKAGFKEALKSFRE